MSTPTRDHSWSDEDLNASVHDRFRAAFGEPDHALGGGEQWSLQPGPRALGIRILLNGTVDGPGVWVFDPNDRGHGVVNIALKDERQVDAVINQIHERVQRAARLWDDEYDLR